MNAHKMLAGVAFATCVTAVVGIAPQMAVASPTPQAPTSDRTSTHAPTSLSSAKPGDSDVPYKSIGSHVPVRNQTGEPVTFHYDSDGSGTGSQMYFATPSGSQVAAGSTVTIQPGATYTFTIVSKAEAEGSDETLFLNDDSAADLYPVGDTSGIHYNTVHIAGWHDFDFGDYFSWVSVSYTGQGIHTYAESQSHVSANDLGHDSESFSQALDTTTIDLPGRFGSVNIPTQKSVTPSGTVAGSINFHDSGYKVETPQTVVIPAVAGLSITAGSLPRGWTMVRTPAGDIVLNSADSANNVEDLSIPITVGYSYQGAYTVNAYAYESVIYGDKFSNKLTGNFTIY